MCRRWDDVAVPYRSPPRLGIELKRRRRRRARRRRDAMSSPAAKRSRTDAPPGAAAQATAVAPASGRRRRSAPMARASPLAGLRPGKSPALTGTGLRGRSPGPQKSPAEILSSKKRQRTPPSADRRDRPELPWTDFVCVGKGTYGEVYRARPDDARRRTQGTTVALKKFIQRDDDWGFPDYDS